MTTQLLPTCTCGADAADEEHVNGIPILRCRACGTVRQRLAMTRDALGVWYAQRYFAGVYQHTYDHDRAVAETRLNAYAIQAGARVLDVGAGNGAFVDAARERGLDAWGQDLAHQSEGPFTYVGDLHAVAFPTESFDAVTMHDVLEHVPDPHATLAEVRRVLRPGGMFILDFPHFFSEHGRHHWKPVEHLWYLTVEQLLALLRHHGFTVARTAHPIPSKVVVTARREAIQRPRILVPPGIGDAYWVTVKLPGFLRTHGFADPDVLVQESGPRRTEPFLRSLPFVHAAGVGRRPPEQITLEAYRRAGRTVFRRATDDADYFISYNGVLGAGRSLAQVDPDFGVDWYPRMHEAKAQTEFRAVMTAGGPYCVAYLPMSGLYTTWLGEFGPSRTLETLWLIRRALNMRIVFLGAAWDSGSLGATLASREEPSATWVNLIGQTSYDEMLGLLRGASLVFGYPSGATILAAVLFRPTVLLWSRHFTRAFWTNTVPPDARYAAVAAMNCTPESILATARRVIADV